MRLFRLQPEAPTHEDLFIARYAALLRQARHLLGRDGLSEAEDIVHDAFVRFTVSRPDLAAIDNIDAYLTVLLRNLHVSRLRRRDRNPVDLTTLIEFDSAEAGLRAVDLRAWVGARDTLRTLCQYGCVRCRSSRAGSIFLLRFFHGFVPSEIAQIARTTTGAVDEWIRRARREARAFLLDPNAIAFSAPAAVRSAIVGFEPADLTIEPGDTISLLAELRRAIFKSRHQVCLTSERLDDLYDSNRTADLSNGVLAEIVTCPACLDVVSNRFDLDPPSTRMPSDSVGHAQRTIGISATRNRSVALASSLKRRARETFEHRPETLHLAVNGHVLGTQHVRQGGADLELRLSLTEPVGWVELFGDHDVCLAMLDVLPPPAGPAFQSRDVGLSDGRMVTLSVTFDGPWPVLRMTYADPSAGAQSTVFDEHVALPGFEADQGIDRRSGLERLARWWEPWKTGLGIRRPVWQLASLALFIWLFFFTPGLEASAATHVARSMAALVSRAWQWITVPAPIPARPVTSDYFLRAPISARRPSPSVVTLIPRPPVALDRSTVLTSALNALAVLQRHGAYLGQEVSLENQADGTANLSVLVADEARRRVLRADLATLRQAGGLRIVVQTYEERVAGRAPVETTGVRAYDVEYARPAAHELLRAYLRRTTGGEQPTESDITRLAGLMVQRSRVISQHVWALSHLMKMLSAEPQVALSKTGTEILVGLVSVHARAAEAEVTRLRQELEPIVAVEGDFNDVDQQIASSNLNALIASLADLNARREEAITAAFVVSRDPSSDLALQSAAFWNALRTFELIARRIQQPFSLDPRP